MTTKYCLRQQIENSSNKFQFNYLTTLSWTRRKKVSVVCDSEPGFFLQILETKRKKLLVFWIFVLYIL